MSSCSVSVRNTFVHFAQDDEIASDSEDGLQPIALRSKTAPNLCIDVASKLDSDGHSDDGKDTTDVTESSASSSDAEWQGSFDRHADDSSNARSEGSVERQPQVRRTVTFASSCSESSTDEPAFVDVGIGRERRGRRSVTWHADLVEAPKDEPVFVVPLSDCDDGEGRRRRRRVATWHGAGPECSEEMLDQPKLERFMTRDSFESETEFLQPQGWLTERQEVDQSPQPVLSRVLTRDSFELQDGSPCKGQQAIAGASASTVNSVDPSFLGAPCVGMMQSPCLIHPWMMNAAALAQWSMMAACQQALAPNGYATRQGDLSASHRAQGQQPTQQTRVMEARPAVKRTGGSGQRTTVMVRNLPNNYSRDDVLNLLDTQGFAGKYDFIYFPIDFDTSCALGYAFVNLVETADAEALMEALEGFCQWRVTSEKICQVAWSQHSQGLETHVQRYRNSPLMHELVPDGYRPVLFENGQRVAFPLPTKKIKAPRKGTRLMLV